jgi:streptogramin lyase
MQHPQGVAAVEGGFVVADTYNHRLRRFTWTTGEVVTIAGASEPGSADGDGAFARFDEPNGLAPAGGTLYVADTGNDAIRRIDMATGRVETVPVEKA